MNKTSTDNSCAITVSNESLTSARQFFPYGYELTFDATLSSQSTPLTPLLTAFVVHELLPREVLTPGGVLRDIKGGEWSPEPNLTSNLADEELLYISGEALLNSELPALPWILRVSTSFKEFLAVHHIVYQPRITLSSDLAAFISPLAFLQSIDLFPNIRIRELRFALNFFRSKRAFFFGFSPVVSEALHIEASEKSAQITLWGEELKQSRFELLDEHGVATKIRRLPAMVFGPETHFEKL